MKDAITILTPSSILPSHPSTEIIEDSIGRVRSYPELRDCKLIIMLDGLREEFVERGLVYEEYKRCVIESCGRTTSALYGCVPIVFDKHTHQANMTRKALTMVETPAIFYVEHDTFPVGEIDFAGIVNAVINRLDVNYLRLHIFDRILDENLDRMQEGRKVYDLDGVPAIKTFQWSQRPHLAKTEFYRQMINECFSTNNCTMIEDVMEPALSTMVRNGKRPDELGMWIYAPPVNMLRSDTNNGRREDIKFYNYFSVR